MRTYLITTMMVLAVGLANSQHCRGDAEFSLVIDPFTGATSLRNDANTNVELDGYFVTSPGTPVLNPLGTNGWMSLEDSGVPGWAKTFSTTGNRLGEVNLFDSLAFNSGQSVPIGNAYVPYSPLTFGEVEPGLSTLNFTYSLATETFSRIGDVEFSARNTLLLVVDPATGDASLENRSGFSINLDSYLIKSNQNVLDGAGWDPLSISDSGWFSSTGLSNRLAEANLFGSTFLAANGGTLPIGSPIDPLLLNDERDIELEFTIEGFGSIKGGVLFASSSVAGPDADFNMDGSVDGLDLGIWQGNYAQSGGQPNGDADGDGQIDGRDFLIWQRQYTGAGNVAAIAAVPEPSGLFLIACGIVLMGNRRPQRVARVLV